MVSICSSFAFDNNQEIAILLLISNGCCLILCSKGKNWDGKFRDKYQLIKIDRISVSFTFKTQALIINPT